MTVANALSFIRRAHIDKRLRKKLNESRTSEELLSVLDKEKFAFTHSEFDEAFYMWLVKCQEIEEAEQLKELKTWWVMLNRLLDARNLSMRAAVLSV
ncbi:MAG: hypothetical protein KKE62_08135 [Proteobacteria bacterium]|nr:hypothetical protein [Pseudomonadota bacterium]MBU1388373.1 hypothetical protein [Pseudomonadota bacterium]MBU1542803.1 hypothetical protein [Pseudomonadota bacterium]MBU2430367.1 hypothetical protein [Pseudomonadota bacterium]MBU2481303.1 hypothetical protein [Pseudomonadota bacterium]